MAFKSPYKNGVTYWHIQIIENWNKLVLWLLRIQGHSIHLIKSAIVKTSLENASFQEKHAIFFSYCHAKNVWSIYFSSLF